MSGRPSAGPRSLVVIGAIGVIALVLLVALLGSTLLEHVSLPGAQVEAPVTSPEGGLDVVPGSSLPAARPETVPGDAEPAIVDRVVDGDTIRVIAEPGGSIPEGGSIRVRLLNVDAPELGRGGTEDECGAREATLRVEELLGSGDLVWLVADVRDRDRFDRPLRGVWTEDGVFVNRVLVEEGWAVAALFEPNDRFHAQMVAAESLARAQGVGIHGTRCR